MITDFSSHLHTYLIIHHMYPSSLMQVPKHSLIYFCGATCASKHKFTRRTKDGVATLGKKALINHAPNPSFPPALPPEHPARTLQIFRFIRLVNDLFPRFLGTFSTSMLFWGTLSLEKCWNLPDIRLKPYKAAVLYSVQLHCTMFLLSKCLFESSICYSQELLDSPPPLQTPWLSKLYFKSPG